MNDQTHTKTPWNEPKWNGHFAQFYFDEIGGGNVFVFASEGADHLKEIEAMGNANHIVNCVNNHGEIIEKAEAFLSEFDQIELPQSEIDRMFRSWNELKKSIENFKGKIS